MMQRPCEDADLDAPDAADRAGAVTEASEFSRALFQRFGFRVVGIERTMVRGVELTRHAMRRGE